jgi:hypothetical protein
MPIEKAKEELLKKGLPVRGQEAGGRKQEAGAGSRRQEQEAGGRSRSKEAGGRE